jgi:hypothetical protein
MSWVTLHVLDHGLEPALERKFRDGHSGICLWSQLLGRPGERVEFKANLANIMRPSSQMKNQKATHENM